MARPIKKGLDYFSLDVDIFDNDTIMLIEAEFGAKSILIALRLLCKIYKNGYYYKWGEDECLLLARQMGAEFTPDYINNVVLGLVKRSFFNKELFEECNVLTSKNIQERFIKVVKERNYKVEIEPKLSLLEFSARKTPENPSFFHENPTKTPDETEFKGKQCDKVKERKVKKSKEKNLSLLSPSLQKHEGDNSSEITLRERERIFLIFFFKNFISPEKEVDRFINHYQSTDWRRSGGAKIINRLALAATWRPEKETLRFPEPFLKMWKEIYETLYKSTKYVNVANTLLSQLHAVAIRNSDTKGEKGEICLTVTDELRQTIEQAADIVAPILRRHYAGYNIVYKIKPTKQ